MLFTIYCVSLRRNCNITNKQLIMNQRLLFLALWAPFWGLPAQPPSGSPRGGEGVGAWAHTAEEIRVTTFRHAGPLPVLRPVMVDTTDVQGKCFDEASLLQTWADLSCVGDGQLRTEDAEEGIEGRSVDFHEEAALVEDVGVEGV